MLYGKMSTRGEILTKQAEKLSRKALAKQPEIAGFTATIGIRWTNMAVLYHGAQWFSRDWA